MKIFNKGIVAVLLIVLTAACSLEKKASKKYDRGEFQNSIEMYSKVLDKEGSLLYS